MISQFNVPRNEDVIHENVEFCPFFLEPPATGSLQKCKRWNVKYDSVERQKMTQKNMMLKCTKNTKWQQISQIFWFKI